MTAIVLKERTPRGKVGARASRHASLVPGVLYGDHIASRHFALDERDIPKLRVRGSSGLIDVQLAPDTGPLKAIVQDIQTNAVSGRYEHIDLYQVRMDRAVHTDVHLSFVGESTAVKDLGGVLVKQHIELPIECLPGDLVNHIDVSISLLKTFEDVIRVKDVAFPQGIKTSLPADEIIAAVSAPRSEEEMSMLSGEVAPGEGPEVLTEKKKEEAADAVSGAEKSSPGSAKEKE